MLHEIIVNIVPIVLTLAGLYLLFVASILSASGILNKLLFKFVPALFAILCFTALAFHTGVFVLPS